MVLLLIVYILVSMVLMVIMLQKYAQIALITVNHVKIQLFVIDVKMDIIYTPNHLVLMSALMYVHQDITQHIQHQTYQFVWLVLLNVNNVLIQIHVRFVTLITFYTIIKEIQNV